MTFSPCPKPERRVRVPKEKAPRKGLPRKNVARKAERFLTDFGGEEYLAFIKSLPCDICKAEGFTVAAHLTSRGAGGKAEVIAPLCCTRSHPSTGNLIHGCHEQYDLHNPVIRAHEPRLRELAKARRQAFRFAIEHTA